MRVLSGVIVAVMLLGSPAEADCAWVLWTKFLIVTGTGTTGTSFPWTPGSGYTSQEACLATMQQDLETRAAEYTASGSRVTRGTTWIDVYGPTHSATNLSYMSHSHRCLPAGTDPRLGSNEKK